MSDDGSRSRQSGARSRGNGSGLFARLTRGFRPPVPEETSVQVDGMLREREKAGDVFDSSQRDLITNATAFNKVSVHDVMVPRADIDAIEVETDLGTLARLFAETQHSRLPVYRATLDEPVGFVHVKDVLALLAPDEEGNTKGSPGDLPLARLRRELLFVPHSMKLPNLLRQMRAKRCHMALVVDEYGGTDGLVTIEDLVEQLVGEIDDEHDDDPALQLVERGAGHWEADARVELDDFTERTGLDLMVDDLEDDEIDTLGGLVAALAGRVPARGEVLRHPAGHELTVLDADPRRIKRLRLKVAVAQSAADGV
jgi:CBS domain containing-hemolysin-like protein